MAEVAKATLVLDGDSSRFKRSVSSANRVMKSKAQRMRRTARRVGKAVAAGLAVAGAAMVAIGVKATKMAAAFEKSTTRLQTLVGLSADRVQALRGEILKLAPAVGIAPKRLSEAMFAITSGGLRGAEAMSALRQAAKASAIGLGSVEEIGRTATAALQAFGDSGLTAEKAIDTMVATVRAGNVQADELAGSLGRVIGIADAAGVSFEELNAFIATFTRLGAPAEVAATALRSTLSSLIRPTKEQRETFRALGTSVEAFRREIQDKGLAESLIGLIESAEGNVEVIGQLIPNVRALAGVLGTAGSQSESLAQIQGEIQRSLGLTNESFRTTQRTAAQMAGQLRAMGQVILVRIGQEVLPVVRDLVSEFAEAIPRAMAAAIQGFQGLVNSILETKNVLEELFGTTARERFVEQTALLDELAQFRNRARRAPAELTAVPGRLRSFTDLPALATMSEIDRAYDQQREKVNELKSQYEEATSALRGFNDAMDRLKGALRGVSIPSFSPLPSSVEDLRTELQGMIRDLSQSARAYAELARQAATFSLAGQRPALPGVRRPVSTLGPSQMLERGFAPPGIRTTGQTFIGQGLGANLAIGPAPTRQAIFEETQRKIKGIGKEGERVSSVLGQLVPAFGNLIASVSGLDSTIAQVVNLVSQSVMGLARGGPLGLVSGFVSGFAGFFQHGGRIESGKFGVVGESGPEVVAGPAAVAPMPAGASALGGTYLDVNNLSPVSRFALAHDPVVQAAVDEIARVNQRGRGELS